MDAFTYFFRDFHEDRNRRHNEFKEMLFYYISEEAKRTKSKTRPQIRRVISTIRGLFEDAWLVKMFTKEEIKALRAVLEEDAFKLMNPPGKSNH